MLVYRLLRGLTGAYPGLHLKNVVDDVSLQVVGTVRFVVNTLGPAGLAFARGLEELRLPLSHGKTVFVASSSEVRGKLEDAWRRVRPGNWRCARCDIEVLDGIAACPRCGRTEVGAPAR